MGQGHSGMDIIETFEKTEILVENVPMFLRHSSNLLFEYADQVVSFRKRMCMSHSQMVNILTFGTDATFRTMLVLTEEQWRNCLAIQTFLSTPQKLGEVMKTVESAL